MHCLVELSLYQTHLQQVFLMKHNETNESDESQNGDTEYISKIFAGNVCIDVHRQIALMSRLTKQEKHRHCTCFNLRSDHQGSQRHVEYKTLKHAPSLYPFQS